MFPGMPPTDPRSIHGAANVRGALAKHDRWANREEAKLWLLGIKNNVSEKRSPGSEIERVGVKKKDHDKSGNKGKTIWSKWDNRALALYVVCGAINRRGGADTMPDVGSI